MAIVTLRSPLRELVGGRSQVEVGGSTVAEILGRLQADHPKLVGWVLDERGSIREHVNVFVNGDRRSLDSPVQERDRVHILAAISGGAGRAEVLVGTRKGLFVLRGERGSSMDVAVREFAGQAVEYAVRDPRTGRYYASVTNFQYGPRIFFTDDPSGGWEQAKGPAFPEDTEAAVKRVWVIQPGEEDGVVYAGVDPAALFRSDDGGVTWELNRALWDQPSRSQWQPGAGGLCLHSIATWSGQPDRLAVGISAAGVWLTDDGGKSWRRGIQGLVPGYLPEEAREEAPDLCVHNVHRTSVPETLYMQFHGGVYRSDDAGESWNDIGSRGGLPSDFGFPLVAHPRDPARAYVIPLSADVDRVTPEGKLRVYATGDRGETWEPRGEGLPQRDAYLTILRQAFCHDGGDPLGLYFGATSGAVFGSSDEGATWNTVVAHLPPVLSVRASA